MLSKKNKKLVNNINNGLIDSRNNINRKEISDNENPKKVADIVDKILDFNKQQKDKRIKILTPQTKASKITNSTCTSKSR